MRRKFKTGLLLLLIISIQACTTTEKLLDQYPSKPTYKAFAIATNGASGMAWGARNMSEAINLALQICRRKSPTCVIVRLNNYEAKPIPSDYYSSAGEVAYSHKRTYTCSQLQKGEAYVKLLEGHYYLDRDGDGHPCEWESSTYSRTTTQRSTSSNCTWVNGYTRKDGTRVSGHRRCR